MSRVCEYCGKGRTLGNQMTTRGKAKYLGGFGTKVTGLTRRAFQPNLQRVKVTTANGTNKTVRICTQCIRSGAVQKRVHTAPFQMTESKDKGQVKPTPQAKTKAKSK